MSIDALPYGTDQIIDAAMARSLHADACREQALARPLRMNCSG